ncbi:hypothetical protein IL306_014672 [Fusarium sp. DS 682]|nr:hypothetical protein IL306_014672 [Fusarium sp. DS 682]
MSRRSVLRCEPHEQKLLGWDADAMKEAISFREIDGLTDLVYKRLLSKPGMSIPPMGIARTLSNDVSVNGVQPEPSQVTNDLTVSTTPNPTAISLSNIQASKTGSKRTGVVAECDETTEYNTLIDDLDEYLQALGLDPLTEEEAQYTKKLQRFDTNSVDSRPLLLEASRAETPDLSITLQSRDEGPSQLGSELVTEKPTSHGSGDTSRRQPKPHRRGRFSVPFDFKVDPLSAMGLAASILTLVSLATKLARTTAHTYGAFGMSSNKLIFLSRALTHYSAILEAISEILRFSRAETQQDLGLPILYESQALLEDDGFTKANAFDYAAIA